MASASDLDMTPCNTADSYLPSLEFITPDCGRLSRLHFPLLLRSDVLRRCVTKKDGGGHFPNLEPTLEYFEVKFVFKKSTHSLPYH